MAGRFGEAWGEPLAVWKGLDAACWRADLPSDLLAGEGAAEALAVEILGEREVNQWARLEKAIAKRRFEWLRGRVAAKAAVAEVIAQRGGQRPGSAEVIIEPDDWGRLFATVGGEPAGIDVSLAHSGEMAFAVAVPRPLRVGVDLEWLGRPRSGFERLAFRDGERGLIGVAPEEARAEMPLRMWCAKEAVAKAVGHGFHHGFRTVEVVEVGPGPGEFRLAIRDGLATAFPHLAGERFTAMTGKCSDYLFAVSFVDERR